MNCCAMVQISSFQLPFPVLLCQNSTQSWFLPSKLLGWSLPQYLQDNGENSMFKNFARISSVAAISRLYDACRASLDIVRFWWLLCALSFSLLEKLYLSCRCSTFPIKSLYLNCRCSFNRVTLLYRFCKLSLSRVAAS
ncbi:hypothetical protein EYF80_054145 [Liparis tanakae]|uniref:Uncharacterized protein n=1 Tax=Liparis tanakae TaxID=230148 RepID=A0A4Z2F4Q2_9TELE|nr:hypothetical protein EYF80_054145 [Liparis tanakae]